MTLKAGNPDDLNNSLTKAIDDAFVDTWTTLKPEVPLGEAGTRDRQILFSAISQGVLAYLRDNLQSSLTVNVTVTQDNSNITSSNGTTTVTQNAGGSNRVESSGQATTISLDVNV